MDNQTKIHNLQEQNYRTLVLQRMEKVILNVFPQRQSAKKFEDLQGDVIKKAITLLCQWDYKEPLAVGIISNQNGIGKSHLSICLTKKYIYDRLNKFQDSELQDMNNLTDLSIKFVKGYDLLDEIQSTYKHKYETTEDIFNKYTNCAFLCIDDIFSDRNGNDFERQVILKILDKREWVGKPTLFNSNLNKEQIEKIDTRIWSRINNKMLVQFESPLKDYRSK